MNTTSAFANDPSSADQADRRQLLVRIGHEIRNPLNAIVGFAQVIANDARYPLTQRQSERVRTILDIAWHMCAVLTDAVDATDTLGCAPWGDEPRTPVAIAPVITDVVRWMTPRAEALGISLVCNAPVVHVLADTSTLRRILISLVCSAIEQCRTGGRIQIDVKVVSDDVRMVVTSTDPADGLRDSNGLSSSHRLVETLGGRMEVRCHTEEGRAVTVVLPATDHPGATRPS